MSKVKKGKAVKGCDYVGADEEFDKKQIKAQGKEMRTAGIAKELKGSQKAQGYSKKPRVKAEKKNAKPVSGQKKIYK
jgi:phosphotransferase system IIA component